LTPALPTPHWLLPTAYCLLPRVRPLGCRVVIDGEQIGDAPAAGGAVWHS